MFSSIRKAIKTPRTIRAIFLIDGETLADDLESLGPDDPACRGNSMGRVPAPRPGTGDRLHHQGRDLDVPRPLPGRQVDRLRPAWACLPAARIRRGSGVPDAVEWGRLEHSSPLLPGWQAHRLRLRPRRPSP